MITFNKVAEFLLPKVYSIGPLVALGGAALAGGLLSGIGSKKAGEAQATGARDAAAIQAEAAERARADLAPFRAAGSDAVGEYQYQIGQRPSSVPIFDPYQQTAAPTGFAEQGQRFTGSRFTDAMPASRFQPQNFRFREEVPTSRFEGTRFTGGRFEGDRFSYDPQQAMMSPDIQFLQQQGEQSLRREMARNRQLGSGNRLLDFMKFNQGLASQGLQDYFNRQFQMNRENYLRDLGEEESAYQRGRGEEASAYGRSRDEEQSAYDRAIMERELRRQQEAEWYRRAQGEEAETYRRDLGDWDRARALEAENYLRALGEEESAYQRGMTERDIGLQDWQLEQQRQLANQAATQQAVLDRYNLGLQAYNDRMSRLADLINVGSGAGSASAKIAYGTGQGMADSRMDLGAAQAGGILGGYNALGSTLGNLAGLYGLQQSGYFTNPYTQMTRSQAPYSSGIDVGFSPTSLNFGY